MNDNEIKIPSPSDPNQVNLINRSQTKNLKTYTGSETVAILQDDLPWYTPSNSDEMTAQHKNFCTINSTDIGSLDLSRFKEILISSDQSQDFYNAIFPDPERFIHPDIENFVRQGGILSANLYDHSWHNGVWADLTTLQSYSFVGGLKHFLVNLYNDLIIVDSAHPLISGNLPCSGGNCGKVLDEGSYNDIDDYSFSTPGYFYDLPVGTKTIMATYDGHPVTIEYPFGSGVVIATLFLSEYAYYIFDKKSPLANEIAYQDYLVAQRQTRGIKLTSWIK